MPARITQQSPAEILSGVESRGIDMMADAYERGTTLSGLFEIMNPTDAADRRNGDAFDRVMQEAGIITRSFVEYGIHASRGADLLDRGPGGRILFMELASRIWRRAIGQRAAFLSDDNTPGSWQRPYTDAQAPRWTQEIQAAIPLMELISGVQPINGQDYRQYYLTTDAAALRAYRVGESADIPETKLADAEKTNRLKKYGRALTASYEQLRRMRLDKLTRTVAMMAVQAEVDKVAAAIDILVNGDGNSNTAATSYNLTALDTDTTANNMTLKAWLAFVMLFENPFTLTTALMQKDMALVLALLNASESHHRLVDAGNIPIGGFTPINKDFSTTRIGWTSDAPANKIVGFDRRMAIEFVTEIGGDIAETDRFIRNQTQTITLTEVSGFSTETLNGQAVKILVVNA